MVNEMVEEIKVSTPSYIIHHNEQLQRFSISLDFNGSESADNPEPAVLEYHLKDGHVIDFYRTYVPAVYRGKGLAGLLVEKGVEWAIEKGYALNSSCSYVRKKQQTMPNYIKAIGNNGN